MNVAGGRVYIIINNKFGSCLTFFSQNSIVVAQNLTSKACLVFCLGEKIKEKIKEKEKIREKNY